MGQRGGRTAQARGGGDAPGREYQDKVNRDDNGTVGSVPFWAGRLPFASPVGLYESDIRLGGRRHLCGPSGRVWMMCQSATTQPAMFSKYVSKTSNSANVRYIEVLVCVKNTVGLSRPVAVPLNQLITCRFISRGHYSSHFCFHFHLG